jgi:uncharacterized protein
MPPQSIIWRGSATAGGSLTLVVALAVIFAAMRVAGMLGPSTLRWMLPLGFVLMALTPAVLLNGEGRRQIGLVQSAGPTHYIRGIAVGALAALICFAIGRLLFGLSLDNWFVTIAGNYHKTMDTSGFSIAKLHLVFTVPAMLFSPIGEEVFFRGVLQRALEQRLSVKASTSLECAAFGLVHLCHHGISAGASGIVFRPLSGAMWATLMFLVALTFATLRKRSGSLFPAIAAHASFNVVMNTVIFAFLWKYVS